MNLNIILSKTKTNLLPNSLILYTQIILNLYGRLLNGANIPFDHISIIVMMFICFILKNNILILLAD